jgi:hypothetical protein
MHLLVITPIRSRGIALDIKARRQCPAIRGNVMVNSAVSKGLGRATNVARVEVGMPLDPNPLPPLLDATLAARAARVHQYGLKDKGQHGASDVG